MAPNAEVGMGTRLQHDRALNPETEGWPLLVVHTSAFYAAKRDPLSRNYFVPLMSSSRFEDDDEHESSTSEFRLNPAGTFQDHGE